MPQGMSSIDVTERPALLNRRCHLRKLWTCCGVLDNYDTDSVGWPKRRLTEAAAGCRTDKTHQISSQRLKRSDPGVDCSSGPVAPGRFDSHVASRLARL